MAMVTTSSLFSHETFQDLILDPMFKISTVLGAIRRIDTNSTTAYLPTVTPGSVAWTAEGAEIADSGIAASMYPVTPKKLAGLALVSNESLEDANSAGILGDALARQLAAAVDVNFFGTGGGTAPVGLAGTAGIGTVAAGLGTGLDDFATAIGQVESTGAHATVILMSPGRWATLLKQKDGTSTRPLLASQSMGPTGDIQRSIFGTPVVVSYGLPDDTTSYVLDGSRVSVVVRMDGTVVADRSAKFTADVTAVRAVMRIGWAFPYPSAIVKIS